jgi:hypothetical protein
MARAPVSFRPTEAQRQWLDRQRRERGIPVTTVIQLLLEQAMISGARFRLLLAEAEADEQQEPNAQP